MLGHECVAQKMAKVFENRMAPGLSDRAPHERVLAVGTVVARVAPADQRASYDRTPIWSPAAIQHVAVERVLELLEVALPCSRN
jgi:hypothetical protein